MSLQPERISGVRFAVPPAHAVGDPAVANEPFLVGVADALKQDDRRAIGGEAVLHIGAVMGIGSGGGT